MPSDPCDGSQHTEAPDPTLSTEQLEQQRTDRRQQRQQAAEDKARKRTEQNAQREAKRLEKAQAKAMKQRSNTAAARSARRMAWFNNAKQLSADDGSANIIAFVQCGVGAHLACLGEWFDNETAQKRLTKLITSLSGRKQVLSQLALRTARKESLQAAAQRAACGDLDGADAMTGELAHSCLAIH